MTGSVDFSLHQVTSHELVVPTSTAGLVTLDVAPSARATSEAVTDDAPAGLR